MPIKIELQGVGNFKKQSERIQKLKTSIPGEIFKILNKFGLNVWHTITKDYLSGPRPEKLGVVTGLLRSSIRYKITEKDKFAQVTFGTAVPYAAIHEYGGQTKPSVIIPKKADALSFMIGGKRVFFKKVNHPGSIIPARPFLRPGVTDNLDSLKENLNGMIQKLYVKQ